MAVYRNLQEQVFENAKDIEQLQQNTNNLELDIVDEQNKTQHLFADSNSMHVSVMDNDEKYGSFEITPNWFSAAIHDTITGDSGNMILKSNLFRTTASAAESDKHSQLELNPNDLIYYHQGSATDPSMNFTWSAKEQILKNNGFSSRLDSYDRKTHGKYIIDSYTIDEGTQTINLTLSEQL